MNFISFINLYSPLGWVKEWSKGWLRRIIWLRRSIGVANGSIGVAKGEYRFMKLMK